MRNRILTFGAIIVLSVQDIMAQAASFGAVANLAGQFKVAAILIGKAASIGILALAMIWMIYTLTSDSPKKKEAVISFLLAAVFNTVFWGLIGAGNGTN